MSNQGLPSQSHITSKEGGGGADHICAVVHEYLQEGNTKKVVLGNYSKQLQI